MRSKHEIYFFAFNKAPKEDCIRIRHFGVQTFVLCALGMVGDVGVVQLRWNQQWTVKMSGNLATGLPGSTGFGFGCRDPVVRSRSDDSVETHVGRTTQGKTQGN